MKQAREIKVQKKGDPMLLGEGKGSPTVSLPKRVISMASLASAVGSLLSGCSSLHDESGVMGALTEFAKKQSVVEATIEFSGAAPQWVGPRSLTLQVLAREGQNAQISVTPDLQWRSNGESELVWLDSGRAPAGALSFTEGKSGPTTRYTVDLAREQLNQLALVMESDKNDRPAFSQCLYPVRARLTRSDGALVEKNGCRGMGGWEQKVSEFTAQVVGVYVASRNTTAPAAGKESAPVKPLKVDEKAAPLAHTNDDHSPANEVRSPASQTHGESKTSHSTVKVEASPMHVATKEGESEQKETSKSHEHH